MKSKFFKEKKLVPIINNISIALGESLSFILFIIYKIRNKRKNNLINQLIIKQNNNNKISWKKKFVWILLLSILVYVSTFLDSIIWMNMDNNINLWAFYIIFLSLFSFWILKKYIIKASLY